MLLYNILFSSSVSYFNAVLLSADELLYSNSLTSSSVKRLRYLTIVLLVPQRYVAKCAYLRHSVLIHVLVQAAQLACQYIVNIVRRNTCCHNAVIQQQKATESVHRTLNTDMLEASTCACRCDGKCLPCQHICPLS